ncbi:protein FAR1-RELATED SEQUENCE 8-like [Chenopodium quinoa]|uniref:protein FAR1-RELATED SEQUENCE 8-like n=1 Tax=Chenopodium quinoa TaxID=63459 RepID=UPI000B792001|nr:protein FAR1-RELATED SEQUENCE 8-like [Chenopodium quinoa]
MDENSNGTSEIEETLTISDPTSECDVAVVAGEAGPSSECVPNSLIMSPIKTIETVETIVSTNKVSVYATVESPKVGMVFKSWKEVESYYKEYAQQQGFGVTRCQGYMSKKNKERRGTTWRCECWGYPDTRARRAANKRDKSMDVSGTGIVDGLIGEDELSRSKRTSKKCECGAMIYASVNAEGLWELRKIHGCLGLDKTEEIVPTVKDLQHEVYKERRARLNFAGGDCAAMMDYFEKMQADNSNFYHTHRLDEDGQMKDVMWVDARSRAAFDYFGDVVCMDATYLTNEYELPFINIVGVNHHGQSIFLGCALVSHEDTNTYSWFVRQWLACMSSNPPNAILTDQTAAIRKALSLEMPPAHHRCYNDFKSPLKKVIYESYTKEEFETQ